MTTVPNMATCEELQQALERARAAVEPPSMHAATDMAGTVVEAGATDPTAAQPELMKEIEDILQAMREAGCPM